MKDESIKGFGLNLRPVEVSDASFILSLRNSPFAAPYISATGTSVKQQQEWTRSQRKLSNDFYYIIESEKNGAIGTVGLYDIQDKEAEWGRLIIKPPYPAVLATALLLFGFAFDRLQLKAICSYTLQTNEKVTSFHNRLGLPSSLAFRKTSTSGSAITQRFERHIVQKEHWRTLWGRWQPVATQSQRFY